MTAPPLAFEVLLVEDDPDDVLLTREAFSACDGRVQLRVVSTGEEALAYLRRQGPYFRAPRPDLVLLDLNLYGMDGREVLAAVKADPALKVIPVIVLTTSDSEQDILRAYENHANCYLTKPVRMDSFAEAARLIVEFWLVLAKRPGGVRC